MKKIFFVILSVISLSVFAGDFKVEFQPWVIEKVAEFEQKGTLKQKSNGFVYVAVSSDFVEEVIPLIDTPGRIVAKKGIGPHISVIYETELDYPEVNEIGQEFSFYVIEVRTVKVNKSKLWLLAVDAPELEILRTVYGLSPLLKNHNFHITIGTEVPVYKELEEAA